MREPVDAAVSAAASKSTYAGAGTTVAGWAVSSELTVLVGLALGIGGFLVNWYYRAKADRREQTEHEMKMRNGRIE